MHHLSFAIRIVLCGLTALFLLLAANFITAVVINAYLRASGDDGDRCRVIRGHQSLPRQLYETLCTEYYYRRWHWRTSRHRKLSIKLAKKEARAARLAAEPKRRITNALGDVDDGAHNPHKKVEPPWRILPYSYPEEPTTALRWEVWSRICKTDQAKRLMQHYINPYTHDVVYPSAGGDPTAFQGMDCSDVTRRFRNIGDLEDCETLAALFCSLYGSELIPTGVRRSSDGYFHGLGVGADGDDSPWTQTPHFGVTSHVERVLAITESRLGAEMYKLNHAQESLHAMMAEMQRQSSGMDHAQQVILQYLIAAQAGRAVDSQVARITAQQKEHFFPATGTAARNTKMSNYGGKE